MWWLKRTIHYDFSWFYRLTGLSWGFQLFLMLELFSKGSIGMETLSKLSYEEETSDAYLSACAKGREKGGCRGDKVKPLTCRSSQPSGKTE